MWRIYSVVSLNCSNSEGVDENSSTNPYKSVPITAAAYPAIFVILHRIYM